ncbi:Sperm motility kinase X [Lemmus lemmus]
MEMIKNHSSEIGEEELMQLDLNASTYEEETLTDHYAILNTLGKGAFAEVKLGYHLLTNVKVAVKILANGKGSDFQNRREMSIMKELDHPYIIKLFHIIESKDYTYMVLEFAAHGDLVTHIEEGGPLQQKQAQHIFCQIVCAVHYCHDNDIAHRDIKLDNILLDGKGNSKLCDFGLAIRVSSGQRCKGLCGTIEYCAPELFSDTEYDARAVDIWSMAVVLYAMLTTNFPFKARTYPAMKREMLNPTYRIPYIISQNSLLEHLIVQMFTVNPEQRPTICDIRQHQWIKDGEKYCTHPSSSESFCNKPNPSIVQAMWGMGYHSKAISECLRKKKFNNIMATYLILNIESPQEHTKFVSKSFKACVTVSSADALPSLNPMRKVSEPDIPDLVSMSAPEVTPLLSSSLTVDSMVSNEWSSRCSFSESISSEEYFSCEEPQEVSTPKDSSDVQTTPSVKKERETPQGMSTTKTLGTQRSSLQTTSKEPQEVSTPKNNSDAQSTPSVKKERETPQGMSTTETLGTQRSSLQTTSKEPQEVSTPKNSTDAQSTPSVKKERETPQGMSTTETLGTQRSSLQTTSREPQEVSTPKNSSDAPSTPCVKKERETPQGMSTTETLGTQRSSLQTTSKEPQEVSTPKNSSDAQSTPCVKKERETPQGMSTTDTLGTQRSSLQTISKEPQEVSTPKNSSDAPSTPCVKKERETPQGMSTIETLGPQRSSLQTTSKNNLQGVLPEDESESKQEGNGCHYRRNSGLLLQFARPKDVTKSGHSEGPECEGLSVGLMAEGSTEATTFHPDILERCLVTSRIMSPEDF